MIRNRPYIPIVAQVLIFVLFIDIASIAALYYMADKIRISTLDATASDVYLTNSRRFDNELDKLFQTLDHHAVNLLRIDQTLPGHRGWDGNILRLFNIDIVAVYSNNGDRVFQWTLNPNHLSRSENEQLFPSTIPTLIDADLDSRHSSYREIISCYTTFCSLQSRLWKKGIDSEGRSVTLLVGVSASRLLKELYDSSETPSLIMHYRGESQPFWVPIVDELGDLSEERVQWLYNFLLDNPGPLLQAGVHPLGQGHILQLGVLDVSANTSQLYDQRMDELKIVSLLSLDTVNSLFADSIQKIIIGSGCLMFATASILIIVFLPASTRVKRACAAVNLHIPRREYRKARQLLQPFEETKFFTDEFSRICSSILDHVDWLETNETAIRGILDALPTKKDISPQHRTEEQQTLQHILDQTPIAIIIHDGESKIHYSNHFAEVIHISAREPSTIDYMFGHCQNPSILREQLDGMRRKKFEMYRHTSVVMGTSMPFMTLEWTHKRMGGLTLDDPEVYILSVGVDVGDRVSESKRLAWMAYRDPMTRLPNRQALLRTMADMCAASQRHEKRQTLCLFHLSPGSNDEQILLAARTLESNIRSIDFLALVESNTFGLIIQEEEKERIERFTTKILAALRRALPESVMGFVHIFALVFPRGAQRIAPDACVAKAIFIVQEQEQLVRIMQPEDGWPEMACNFDTSFLAQPPFRFRPFYDLKARCLSGVVITGPTDFSRLQSQAGQSVRSLAHYETALRTLRTYADHHGVPLCRLVYPMAALSPGYDANALRLSLQEIHQRQQVPVETTSFLIMASYLGPDFLRHSEVLQTLARDGFQLSCHDKDLALSTLSVMGLLPISQIFVDASLLTLFAGPSVKGSQHTEAYIRFLSSVGKDLYAFDVSGTNSLALVKHNGIRYVSGRAFGRAVDLDDFLDVSPSLPSLRSKDNLF